MTVEDYYKIIITDFKPCIDYLKSDFEDRLINRLSVFEGICYL